MVFARVNSFPKRFVTSNSSILFLSIAIQLILGLWFGHIYDTRIFMATGYLVSVGQNPYLAQDLTMVFHNSFFHGMTSVGYPPPWPIILGLIYRLIFPIFPNLIIYNLAIKIPIIIANIGLAYLTAYILKNLGVEAAIIRRARTFLLLSPCILYFMSAWGQFDSMVAFLSLVSIAFIYAGKANASAILLALAISFKPTALPIFPVVLVYQMGKSLRQAIDYFIIFFICMVLFCVAPFIFFGWNPTPIIQGWNAHFTVGGGMSFMTFFELLKNSYQLPAQWLFLGMAWIPALGVGIYAIRHGITGFPDLLKKSMGMTLIFFLTRTWLSEPNIILILPFIVILTSIGELNRLTLAAVWILPLVFTIFNASPPQLLFLTFPQVMTSMLKLADNFRVARLVARIISVVPWQIVGWWIVITCFRKNPLPSEGMQRNLR